MTEIEEMEGATNPKLDADIVEMFSKEGSQPINLRVERWLVRGFELWLKDYPGFNIQDGLRALMYSCVKGRFKSKLEPVPLNAFSPRGVRKAKATVREKGVIDLREAHKEFSDMKSEELDDWVVTHNGHVDMLKACEEVKRKREEATRASEC